MLLIICETSFILTQYANCILISGGIDNQVPLFTITDTKLYVPVVTLSIQKNVKLLDQLKSGLKITINWKKYQSKVSIQARNQYLDYLIDPRFEGLNTLFLLLFENNAHRTSYKGYFLTTVEMKDFNVMIVGKNFSTSQYKMIKEHIIASEKL